MSRDIEAPPVDPLTVGGGPPPSPVTSRWRGRPASSGSPPQRSRRVFQRSSFVRWGFGAISIGVVAVLWQLVSAARDQPFLFPSIGRITSSLFDIVVEDYDAFVITLFRFVIAVGLGLLIGWLTGLLMGGTGKRFPLLLEPILKALTATPAASWVLLAVLWIQTIEYRLTFVVTLLVIPYYTYAVYEGIRRIDTGIVQAVQQFRPNRRQTMWLVLIPNSVADVLSTTRFAAGMSLRILVFAELIAANTGVGALMSRGQRNFRVDELLAITVAMVILTFVLLWLVDRLEARVLRWRPEHALR